MRSVLVLCLLLSLASVSLTFAQEPPGIGVIAPVQGAAVAGPDVTVEVEVFDFTLVPPTGTDANPGEGHIIYYLDVEPVFVPGQPAIPADPDAIYAASDQLTQTFDDVTPGPHTVAVLLVHDNHTPVIPPAIDQVSFTVTAPSETPELQPSPQVTQEARTETIEEATPTPTPTPTPSPTPAVLAAELPNGGDSPGGSGGGTGVWLLIAAAVGVITLAGSVVVILRRRRL